MLIFQNHLHVPVITTCPSISLRLSNVMPTCTCTFAYANGCNIVGQQHATLLGLTFCVHLHVTTTVLALVRTCWV